jgi:hypothetical protein
MSIGNIGAYASNFVSNTISSILGVLGGNESSSSSSSGSNNTQPIFGVTIPSVAGGLTGGTTPALSNQVMSTLLQAQEAGSSAAQSATGVASQAVQSAQQSQQQNNSSHHHHFGFNGLSQFLENLGQTASNSANGLVTSASSTASNMTGGSI